MESVGLCGSRSVSVGVYFFFVGSVFALIPRFCNRGCFSGYLTGDLAVGFNFG